MRSVSTHTADAAAILEYLRTPPAIIVGTSAGATIAVDLAVRRPDLVLVAIAHEAAWRALRSLPGPSQLAALARIGSLTLLGRRADAAEALLRFAYSYRNRGSAWDSFPEEWRHAGREHAGQALADFIATTGNYPSATDLATVKVPVVCTYGALSPDNRVRYIRSLAASIPGATLRRIEGSGHAAAFDATPNFVNAIAEGVAASRR